MRYVTGRSFTLKHTFLDDETALTVDACAVTVTAADGTEAFTDAATSDADEWSVVVDALPQGAYTVTWAGTGGADGDVTDVDNCEVVGGFLFTIPEARTRDEDLTADKFPTEKVRQYRDEVEAEFERITERSFTPRTARLYLSGDGTDTCVTGKFDVASVLAVTVDGVEGDESEWGLTPGGILQAPTAVTDGALIVVDVDYGFRTVPDDVKAIGITRLRSLLAAERSGVPDRATNFVSAEGGQFTLATPGRNGYQTGIPSVDAVLGRYSFNVLNDVTGG